MKYILILAVSAFFSGNSSAQVSAAPSKKLDSISKKVIYFLKSKQPDSIYLMAGKAFKEKITAENFNSITTTKIFPINNFEHVSFVSNTEGISKYKVEGTPALQLLIGLDVDDKIETLLVQEYIPD